MKPKKIKKSTYISATSLVGLAVELTCGLSRITDLISIKYIFGMGSRLFIKQDPFFIVNLKKMERKIAKTKLVVSGFN